MLSDYPFESQSSSIPQGLKEPFQTLVGVYRKQFFGNYNKCV